MHNRKPISTNTVSRNLAGQGGTTTKVLEKFYGRGRQDNTNLPADPYDEKIRTTLVLPDILEGNNKVITNQLASAVLTKNSFLTKFILPIERRDNANAVEWSTFEFLPTLPGITPSLGVSRLIKSNKSGGRATFERRGLGYRVGHGFALTAEGQRYHIASLAHIDNMVAESNNFNALYALLTADQHITKWESESGHVRNESFKELLQNDIDFWDVGKKKNGLEVLDTYITDRMEKYRGRANTYILHPKIPQYLTIARSEKTDYYIAGENGPTNVRDGVENYRTLRGNRVYTTRSYDLDQNGNLDPMKNPIQIGEYHPIFDRRRGGNDYTGFTSKELHAQIYDQDIDNFTELSTAYFITNSQRFNAEGELLHINEVDNYNVEASEEDKNADPLHYRDSSGKLKTTKYMGQIVLPTADIIDIANSAANAMQSLVRSNSAIPVEQRWNDGLAAVALIEEAQYDESVTKFIIELKKQVKATQQHPKGPGSQPSVALPEAKPNSYGFIDLPIGEFDFSLPPFYASYPGLKTIAVAAGRGEDYLKKRSVSPEWAAKVRDFVELIDVIVSYLSKFFPNSALINKDYASSWFHKPNAQTVFFENTVTKGPRSPIFVNDIALTQGTLIAGEFEDENNPNENIKNEYKLLYNKYTDFLTANSDNFDENIINVNAKEFLLKVANATLLEEGNISEYSTNARNFGLIAATLSTLKLSPNKETNAKIFNILYNELKKLVSTQAGPKLTVTVNDYIKRVSTFIDKNESLFKFTSPRAVRLLETLTKAFNTHTASSKAGKFRVVDRRYDDDQAGYSNVSFDPEKYKVRLPLTYSPALFTSAYEYLSNNDDKELGFAFASPDNPDRIITATEFAEYYEAISGDRLENVHPSLIAKEMDIGFDMTHLAAVRNATHQLNLTEKADDVRQHVGYAQPNIGESYTEFQDIRRKRQSYGIGTKERDSRYGNANSRLGFDGGFYAGKKDRNARGSSSLIRGVGQTSATSIPRSSRFSAGVTAGASSIDDLRDNFDIPELQSSYADVEKNAPTAFIAAIAKVYLTNPTNQKNFIALDNNNITLPISFIAARPHARYESATAIKVQAGTETGATYMANPVFTLGDDPQRQEHIGHFTFKGASVVHNPKNVWVQNNVFICGYKGGLGAKAFENNPEYYYPTNDIYSDGSVFVLAVARNEPELPNPISITGRYTFGDNNLNNIPENQKPHYSSWVYYNALWGWADKESKKEYDLAREDDDYFFQYSRANTLCWLAHTKYYNPVSRKFDLYISGTGHWKDDETYAGVAPVRRGQFSEYNPPSRTDHGVISYNQY